MNLTLAIGGTPAPGLVIAAAGASTFWPVEQPNGDFEFVAADLVGVLVDWFPDPSRGWHVGAMLGLARLRVPHSSGGTFGGMVLGGYDFWFTRQISWGPTAIFSVTSSATITADSNGADTGFRYNALFAGLGLMFTFH